MKILSISISNISFVLSHQVTDHVNALVHERSNSSALAMELRLSYTNLSMWLLIHPGIKVNPY